MILAGYSEITNNFDRPVFSGVGLESFFFEDLDSDSDVNDSDLDSDTRDSAQNCPSPARVHLVFFSIVLYLLQSEFGLVLSLTMMTCGTASYGEGFPARKMKTDLSIIPNFNQKLDPCISRRSKITF